MNTTRQFPRTLMEAFPQDHSAAIEGPTKEERNARFTGLVLVAMSAAFVVTGIVMAVKEFL